MASNDAHPRRPAAAAWLAAGGDRAAFGVTYASVRAHTPADVPIVIGDEGADAWLDDVLGCDAGPHVIRRVTPAALLSATDPADVALLSPGCVVTDGWLEGLRTAAHSDSTVAGAAPPVEPGATASGVPAAPPRLAAVDGRCLYVRRSALALAGGLDPAFTTAAGAAVDLAHRCAAHGLQIVLGTGAAVDVTGASGPSTADAALVRRRHPIGAAADEEPAPAVERAAALARRATEGIDVTIDGRALGPMLTGTQVQVLELIAALSRSGEAQLRVVVTDELGAYAREALPALDRVEIVPASEVHAMRPAAIAHRPSQVAAPSDLEYLALMGRRAVITHQDLIAYRIGAYFDAPNQWLRHRALTRQALAFADAAVFISAHGLDDALADDLVTPEHARVVHNGVDHRFAGATASAARPAGLDALGDLPFLLCLGTDFLHKNRPFALAVLSALRERHGWNGQLVLAGPNVPTGSSAALEVSWAIAHPGDAEAVLRLGAVSEEEKAWLYAGARAVLYPTTYEGFGLVPFEAAEAGVPCLFAPQASLPEVLPTTEAALVPWDAAESSDRAIALLVDEAARRAHVASIRADGERFTWDTTAAGMLAVYDEVLRRPASALATDLRERLLAPAAPPPNAVPASPATLPQDLVGRIRRRLRR